jgi:hypothetical protein
MPCFVAFSVSPTRPSVASSGKPRHEFADAVEPRLISEDSQTVGSYLARLEFRFVMMRF